MVKNGAHINKKEEVVVVVVAVNNHRIYHQW